MNLNIFKRIADLEETISEIYGLLDAQISQANALAEELSKLRQAKQTDSDKIEKRRAYARAYYQATKAKRAK
jgi:uncharacterized protein YwgA